MGVFVYLIVGGGFLGVLLAIIWVVKNRNSGDSRIFQGADGSADISDIHECATRHDVSFRADYDSSLDRGGDFGGGDGGGGSD